MKVGIIGVGKVGCACALAMVGRGSAREIVLVDRTRRRAEAVATDLRYGLPLSRRASVSAGDYDALAGAALVMITVGVNEKTGGATDRNDPQGRLRLLEKNAAIYHDVVPRVVRAAPEAVLLVVTDPPDPLADIARGCARHERVLSSGTFLDSLRFRTHLAQHFEVDPTGVEAQVVGDHGTSQVFLWSGARVAGVPVNKLLEARSQNPAKFRDRIEREVRYANITIIEGNEASQFGIGIVSARIAEIVVRDERAVIPIGSFNRQYGVTLSLPSVVGRGGVIEILPPDLSDEERLALERSAANLKQALARAA
jgi:L-lactate dehydrogenase